MTEIDQKCFLSGTALVCECPYVFVHIRVNVHAYKLGLSGIPYIGVFEKSHGMVSPNTVKTILLTFFL